MSNLNASIASLAVMLGACSAHAQFLIDWYTVDGGGGTSAGGNLSLMATIGQHDAGAAMTGGAFSLTGGFWGVGTGPAPCLADFNRDGQVDFFDYLDFIQAFANEDPSADFNRDGQVDFFDYLDFIEAFAAGC